MKDLLIKEYATTFRKAIEIARDNGKFESKSCLARFPHGCCGVTSDLLAEYLKGKGIDTIWYSAQLSDYSHRWLIVKDERINPPKRTCFSYPTSIQGIIAEYGLENPEKTFERLEYEDSNLREGLIIDITGDQFWNYSCPVYVGKIDDFHQCFKFIEAKEYIDLNINQSELYKTIMDCIEEYNLSG